MTTERQKQDDEGYRSHLTPYAPLMRDVDEKGPHKLAARQWHESGAVVILPASKERLDWQDRELLDAICTRLYGPREESR